MKKQIEDHVLLKNDPKLERIKAFVRQNVTLIYFLSLFAIASPGFYTFGKIIGNRAYNQYFVKPQLISEMLVEKQKLKTDDNVVAEFNRALDITINELINDKVFDKDLALKIKSVCRLSFTTPGELVFLLYGVHLPEVDWELLKRENPELRKELTTIYEIGAKIYPMHEDRLFEIYSKYGLRSDLLSPETYKKLQRMENKRTRLSNQFGTSVLGDLLSKNDQMQRENRLHSERIKVQNRRALDYKAKALKLRNMRPRV